MTLLTYLQTPRPWKIRGCHHCHRYNRDIAHSWYGLLTAVKTRYPLTSIRWPCHKPGAHGLLHKLRSRECPYVPTLSPVPWKMSIQPNESCKLLTLFSCTINITLHRHSFLHVVCNHCFFFFSHFSLEKCKWNRQTLYRLSIYNILNVNSSGNNYLKNGQVIAKFHVPSKNVQKCSGFFVQFTDVWLKVSLNLFIF